MAKTRPISLVWDRGSLPDGRQETGDYDGLNAEEARFGEEGIEPSATEDTDTYPASLTEYLVGETALAGADTALRLSLRAKSSDVTAVAQLAEMGEPRAQQIIQDLKL